MGLFTRDDPSENLPAVVGSVSDDMSVYRAKALPYNAFRPLTASASRIKLTDGIDMSNLRRRRMEDKIWQEDAWNSYDAIGEIKYAFNMMASVASRVRLYVAVVSDEGRSPTSVEDTPDLTPGLALASTKSLDRLFRGASQGISQMIRNMILNLCVAGECLLVQVPAKLSTSTPESWEIRSVDEIVMAGDGRTVMLRSRQGISTQARDIQKLPPEAFVGRIWRAHARWSDEPDSSMRSVLDLASELLLLNRTFRATARSRLNAGALFIPDGLSAAADSDVHEISDINPETGEPVFMPVEDTDAFEEELLEAMTLPIQDESSASAVVPLLIRGPSELGDAIKQFKFERSFDPSLAQRADRVLERILQGLDVPKEAVTGLSGIKYCLSESTQCLTRQGWRNYSDVEVGDDILTYNHDNGYAQWQPIQALNVFNVDPDEELVEIHHRNHHSISTKDHRWPVIKTHQNVRPGTERRFVTSESLACSDLVPLAAPAIDIPQEQKYTDAFVELVAWYWTEGNIVNYDAVRVDGTARRRYAMISQSRAVNSNNVIRITTCLTQLFGEPRRSKVGTPSWNLSSSSDRRTAVFVLNDEASKELTTIVSGKEKIVSLDFIQQLTPAQLELFIDISIAADGHVQASGSKNIFQKNKNALAAFELACILTGKGITWHTRSDGYQIGITNKTSFRPKSPRRSREHLRPRLVTDVTSKVWCPTTANHTWYARHNDTVFITGNSNAVQIDENLYKAHIEPLILLICDALTSVYLHPALLALGFNRPQVERVMVWYDPSEIVTRPNKAEDAKYGFDNNLISAQSWRKVHGFSESDAPDPKETLLRTAMERGVLPPELVQQLLYSLAPDLLDKLREDQQASSPAPLPQDVENILKG